MWSSRQCAIKNRLGTTCYCNRGSTLVTNAIKSKSAREICCSKTLMAKPDTWQDVKQLCQDVTAYSQQQMANRSNGIKEFNCMEDGWENHVIHFWERYESNVTMGRHNTKPEIEEFMKRVAPLLEKPVGMALYEYRNGQIGAVSIQSGAFCRQRICHSHVGF
eukprot:GHRR01020958.1.p1 GENE.GHRR01020958.1~~GHRR01020958.1.p1  ORF type:complete len:162 (+),score=33.46 GHRR01020958.1:130-615(+)